MTTIQISSSNARFKIEIFIKQVYLFLSAYRLTTSNKFGVRLTINIYDFRWYFDQNLRQCLQFSYSGLGGNENNFLTAESCATKCPGYLITCILQWEWKCHCTVRKCGRRKTYCFLVLQNPCSTNPTGNTAILSRCSAQNGYSCPTGSWCHIGGNAETTVCCPTGLHIQNIFIWSKLLLWIQNMQNVLSKSWKVCLNLEN